MRVWNSKIYLYSVVLKPNLDRKALKTSISANFNFEYWNPKYPCETKDKQPNRKPLKLQPTEEILVLERRYPTVYQKHTETVCHRMPAVCRPYAKQELDRMPSLSSKVVDVCQPYANRMPERIWTVCQPYARTDLDRMPTVCQPYARTDLDRMPK